MIAKLKYVLVFTALSLSLFCQVDAQTTWERIERPRDVRIENLKRLLHESFGDVRTLSIYPDIRLSNNAIAYYRPLVQGFIRELGAYPVEGSWDAEFTILIDRISHEETDVVREVFVVQFWDRKAPDGGLLLSDYQFRVECPRKKPRGYNTCDEFDPVNFREILAELGVISR